MKCSYTVDCRSGPVDLTFTCTPDGSSIVQWRVVSNACSFPYDTCLGGNVSCASGGTWVTRPPEDPPQLCSSLCPEAKPAPGQAHCVSCPLPDCSVCSAGVCGYPCSFGDGWTVGKVYRAGASCTDGVWLFDGACGGDCSKEEIALIDFANANKSCTTAADCKIVRSECAFTKESCAGGFYVNASTDVARWNELSGALSACTQKPGSQWNCVACDAIDPAPDCISGHCMAKR